MSDLFHNLYQSEDGYVTAPVVRQDEGVEGALGLVTAAFSAGQMVQTLGTQPYFNAPPGAGGAGGSGGGGAGGGGGGAGGSGGGAGGGASGYPGFSGGQDSAPSTGSVGRTGVGGGIGPGVGYSMNPMHPPNINAHHDPGSGPDPDDPLKNLGPKDDDCSDCSC